MNELLKMAWRNLWRNRRRTLITLASVYFSVFFAVTIRGYHLGMWNGLLEGVLHSYTGYVQVHARGYWKNKTLDYSFSFTDNLDILLKENPKVREVVPRLESFALASSGEKTKAVLVSGIDPVKENLFSNLTQKLQTGHIMHPEDTGVLLSQRLARFLELSVGDTLVLISQGYQGTSAQGLFPVRGIVKLPAPEWDNMMVYMALPQAQEFYSAGNLVTSLVLDIPQNVKVERITHQLGKKLDPDLYEVMNWKEMLQELYQQWQVDNAGMIIILGLLYLIIGFGIFGTVMMMVNERQREFGILVAIGMKNSKLSSVVSLELLLIASLGVFSGMICSVPLVYVLYHNPFVITGETAKVFEQYGMEPIIQVLWHGKYIINQALSVYIVTFLSMLYPVISIFHLRPVQAIRKS